MRNRGSFLVLVIIFIAGVAWLAFTVKGIQSAQESESWLSAEGMIETTWVDEDRRTDADGDWEDYYEPHLRYSYSVDGAKFSSEKVDFGNQPSYSNRSKANSYLADYSSGAEVEVFYDPAAPGEAVLLREASGSTVSLIGGGLMILLSLGGGIMSLLRRN